MRVILVDDEDITRVSLADDLREAGFETVAFGRGEPALAHLKERSADAIVCDLKLPGMSGLDLLREFRATSPETDVVIMTGFGTIENAVDAMRQGACDYVTKPFFSAHLIVLLERLREKRRMQRDNQALRVAAAEASDACDDHVVVSPPVKALMEEVCRVALGDAHVLLTGETGAGKDCLARAIHNLSSRGTKPFVKITCAVYAGALLESELFGHERGAYTGAEKARPGRFEIAEEGTVYLDDVDDIPLDVQTRLLRVIEERVVERVGSTRLFPVDVRIIASTKQNLQDLVKAGKFRADLYYRLNVVSLRVPPLRERPEDIVPLIHHFWKRGSDPCECRLSEEVLPLLTSYGWPGNVRELRNLVERWKLLARSDDIRVADLPAEIRSFNGNAGTLYPSCFEEAVSTLEQSLLRNALERTNGNKAKAAELLKLKSSTFRNKLAQYGINGD